MDNGFDMERFVRAQEPIYDRVLDELGAGRKTSHWKWFVFPQLRGLGRSETARHYGISSRVEAVAYLEHPVLGPRLRECTELVIAVEGADVHHIFGSPDDLKFGSCMTLFEAVASDPGLFTRAIEKYFAGRRDQATLDLLAG